MALGVHVSIYVFSHWLSIDMHGLAFYQVEFRFIKCGLPWLNTGRSNLGRGGGVLDYEVGVDGL